VLQLDSFIFVSTHNCVTDTPSNQHQVVSTNHSQSLHPYRPQMVQPSRPQMSHPHQMQHFSSANNVNTSQSFHVHASTYFIIRLFLLQELFMLKSKFLQKLYMYDRRHPQISTLFISENRRCPWLFGENGTREVYLEK
jgi:hypothetical protein